MQRLYTVPGETLTGTPWARYPRPQMVRQDWLCLNGPWSLTWGGETATIRVPFCPESLLSGVEPPPRCGEEMIYRRTFSLPEGWSGKRVLLHFGAVNRVAVAALNGVEVARHGNGYLPFSAEITDALRSGENELTVRVVNDLSPKHPWGKQRLDRGGMWYTPVSGIWQTVWLEAVPEVYIRSLTLRTGADFALITAEGVTDGTVTLEGRDYPLSHGQARIRLEHPILWSPEHPHLYRFSVTCGEDRVESYFALRTLSTQRVGGVPRLCLNGKPYFFHGLLDQGYWSDGLYTPAVPECYEQDILSAKALGFNTLRKHIKIEPEQFYYDCDRLGMVVFQDMVNCGTYAYLRDTVLPTLGLLHRRDRRLHRDPETRQNFLDAMEGTVRLLANHPCICLWTIFNEGWGQFCADDAYRRLRALDDTRWIDATSGWFHQRESDVDSLHIYFQKLHLGRKPLPQLLSEFGGYSCTVPAHSFHPEAVYGYRKYTDRNTFVGDLRALYESRLLPLVPQGLCGAVYTQLSDVEDETNGLLTYDRRVQKVRPEELADIARRLQEAIRPAGQD
ncbi:MAG: glycoside hydrolase family 2 [Oscillospiraceae bacterium]|nr:glycoside hydrolase family 2 [Oscillospiraceae bacterium]